VAAFPALLVGLSVAFSGGAFTEFYFYNFFLSKFCHSFDKKWALMMDTKFAYFGLFCISSNALVNLALTYSGVGLLSLVLVTAGVALPPMWAVIGLSAVSGVFAGAASFLLGMDFWIKSISPCNESLTMLKPDKGEPFLSSLHLVTTPTSPSSETTKGLTFFKPIHSDADLDHVDPDFNMTSVA
jgi:hypothetical protein